MNMSFIFIYLLLFYYGSSNIQNVSKSWTAELPTIGTFSSPRTVDLTGDGVLDIVLGGGREEFQASDTAVFALDGTNGDILWTASAQDQIFGSAAFLDINQDGIADVLIGGRSAELMALNGKNGKELWRFAEVKNSKQPGKENWFNFYNPQVIPDQDQDGLEDILVSNGGDVMVEPYDPNRPPGQLAVISGKTGTLLARAQMPDGKETYMSVSISPIREGEDFEIVFGTGGETIGGNLYVGLLSQVMEEDLSKAKRIHSSANKGYIAPAVRADINSDGVLEVIANSVDGKLLAFDGRNFDLLWETKLLERTEAYSSVAVGHFTKDSVPDFFVSHAIGEWPDLDLSIQAMVNGSSGKIEFMDSLGFYQTTTPVAFDWNKDGYDEILMSVNIQEVDQLFQKFFYNILVLIDFQESGIKQVGEVFQGNNLSSTPWIGDLDQDYKLDIIYCHGTNLRHTYTFDGIEVKRLAANIPLSKPIVWGAYQGSTYDGVFRDNWGVGSVIELNK